MASEVAQLLAKLNLTQYNEVFEEEAITEVSLLVSMGDAMLRENLEELGLDAAAVDALAGELFPGATGGGAADDDDDEDELVLEDGDAPPQPAAAAAAGPTVPVDALPDDLTQEEIDAAEAEAQWLLNPLSMLDLSETKERLLKMMAEGIGFQQRGQFANARSVFTRALAMEAPNKRMNASLYYNRSACQRELGQLSLALRDAQKAAELEPTFIKAHWRAADVAIILGEEEEAMESITAGLKVAPRCQPLLGLKLKVKRFE
jgi:tetratricopeptide (TPR) repeat protein